MRIDILSVVPELLNSVLNNSILKRAQEKGHVEICVHNLRDYTDDKYRQVDDYPYGGGAGMVMMIAPIDRCISALKAERSYDDIIYMSPDGELLDQSICNQLATRAGNLILLCGHYKGVDERVRTHLCTREISVGNFVLTGGELAAAIVTDAVVRLLPGVLGDESSALTDSFQDGLVAPPAYTRPANYKGLAVPELLLSGNFAKIEQWRHEQSLIRTHERRPEMLDGE